MSMLSLAPAALSLAPLLIGGVPGGDEGPGFVKEVWPILESRCIECHGPEKQKAGLRLDTREGLFEGVEGWIPVVAGKAGESYLMERVTLPDGDSERMPPKGERLSEEDVEVLRAWIEAGAEWEEPPAPKGDPAREALALAPLSPEQAAGVEAARAALAGEGASVLAVAQGMAAMEANLGLLGERATPQVVAHLAGLAPVLVHLNLARTPVGDAELEVVGRLAELRHLNLARTAVTDAGMAHLARLPKLAYLNLYGTTISDRGLEALAGMGGLRRLFLWQTQVTDAGVAALRERLPELEVVRGVELVPPPAENAPLNSECPVSGSAVDAAFTVEHAGKRIAFCCGDCKGTFEQDPAPYLEKLGLARKAPVNAECPVSGSAIDASVTSEHEGALVAFCCAKCKAAFDADPARFAEKLKGKD